MKRFMYSILVVAVVVLTSGCGKNWLTELAENPNQPSTAPLPLVLPPVLSGYADQVTSGYQSEGNWMGYYAYSGGYSITANTYTYYLNNTNGDWDFWFSTLRNVNYIEQQAAGQENMEYYTAVSKILKAYGYQQLVDSYNEAPYTEAFKGSENFFPTYDMGADIYAACIAQLDSAIILIKETTANNPNATEISDNDIMFGGDMDLWASFANTLKLRFLIRQSAVISAADAKAELAKTEEAGYLGEDALVNPGYLNTTGKQNPLWAAIGTNPAGSMYSDGYVYRFGGGALLNFFKNHSDPRLFFVYAPIGMDPSKNEFFDVDEDVTHYDAAYYGQRSKAVELTNSGGASGIGHGALKGFDASVPLMTAAESYFLQAEAVERGWMAGDAKDLFESGITASFEYYEVELSDGTEAADAAESYYTNGDALTDWDATPGNRKIEAIITQKWAALAISNNKEAWVEYRRTGYPATSVLPLTMYPGATRHIPTKYMFPKSEADRNQDAYKAAVAKGNDPQSSKIFWMK